MFEIMDLYKILQDINEFILRYANHNNKLIFSFIVS